MTAPAFRIENVSAQAGFKLLEITFDLPGEKVNKFSAAVIAEFESVVAELEKRGQAAEVDAVIFRSGKPGNFIAGADINMIAATQTAEEAYTLSRKGHKLLDRWEDLPFPTIVAINGTAMGGGCELSLASSAIIMSTDASARIGLPEVNIGVIPGMGGCVRLPRKVGLAGALDLILTGKTLTGDRALKAGLAEANLAKENFDSAARVWVKQNLEKLKSGDRIAREPKLGGMGGLVGSAMEKTPFGRAFILRKARETVMSKTRGQYPAPLEAIQVLSDTGARYAEKIRGQAREEAMDREARGFGKMAATSISKNLIRIFFLTEGVKKSKGVASEIKTTKVTSAAVLGAGVMGGGIAQLYAEKGISTRMKDISAKALTLGMQSAQKIFYRSLQKRKLTPRSYQQKLNLIAPVLDYSGFGSVEIVVEAVLEKMDVKKAVIKELEGEVHDECVIASNTSSLSISEMQSVMKKPERFGGMHFFNPVHRMPLVEVIRGEKSNDETVSRIFQFAKQLGKMPIVVKDRPGFLVNRLLMPYLNEATWLLQDGGDIEEIDETLLDFGMPMGPMELIDEVGVDVGEKVAHILHEGFGDRMQPAPFNSKIVGAGRLGKKNGKGMYQYLDSSGKKKELNPEIYGILGISPSRGKISREEMVDRCILPMINEAARCLDEKIVESANEVDLGMIMGTGFPPFRGGLLRYADSLGAKTIVEKLKKYQARFGARYEPAPALIRMAEKGETFHRD
ncbi:MAG: enoyl-CoA hydratase/isomerase family protein [Cryobacterium sp.]|nr:enoyl-CoA hydratase/isomerase family protein [Oligoflexia bacterium]